MIIRGSAPFQERGRLDCLMYMPEGDCSPGFMSPAGIYIRHSRSRMADMDGQ